GWGLCRPPSLISVPRAVLVVAVGVGHVPETRDPTAVRGIDVAGALLTAVGLAGVTWALIDAGERGATLAAVWAGAVGVGSLGGFVAAGRCGRTALLAR